MGVENSLSEVLDMDDRRPAGLDPTDDEHAGPEQGGDNLYGLSPRVRPLRNVEAELAAGKSCKPCGEEIEPDIERQADWIFGRLGNRYRNAVRIVSAHRLPCRTSESDGRQDWLLKAALIVGQLCGAAWAKALSVVAIPSRELLPHGG